MPVMAPIKFSFTHICRSVAKQIILLARGTKLKQTQTVDY